MKEFDPQKAFSIFANIAVIAGIVFLAYELRQNTLAIRLSVVQSYSENLADLNYFVASDESLADLLAIASLDPEFDARNVTPGQRLRLLSFWIALLREWESTYNVLIFSGLADELDSSLRGTVAATMAVDPNIYPTWQSVKATFSAEFNELIEEEAAKLNP